MLALADVADEHRLADEPQTQVGAITLDERVERGIAVSEIDGEAEAIDVIGACASDIRYVELGFGPSEHRGALRAQAARGRGSFAPWPMVSSTLATMPFASRTGLDVELFGLVVLDELVGKGPSSGT